jgi:hypothetical protein
MAVVNSLSDLHHATGRAAGIETASAAAICCIHGRRRRQVLVDRTARRHSPSPVTSASPVGFYVDLDLWE